MKIQNNFKIAANYLQIKDLKANNKNMKKYTEQEISITAKILKRFGVVLPVIIDKSKQVVLGDHLLHAADKLGLSEVPTIEITHLSEAEIQMFALAMNKILMMGELQLEDFKIDIQNWLFDTTFEITPEELGFSSIEMDNLLFALDVALPEAEVQELKNLAKVPRVVKKGDLIQLGRHRLYCADALQAENYKTLLGEEIADIIITDPPYNVKIEGNVTKRKQHKEFAQASGEMTQSEFTEFLNKSAKNLAAYSKKGSVHYLFMDWKHISEIQNACKDAYNKLLNICVWNKKRGGMGSFYRSQHEFCFVYQNGPGTHNNNINLGKNGRNRTNVWDYTGMNISNNQSKKLGYLHPTVKPLAMLVDILLDASNYGDIVLDCFGGSGSTLMAAQQCGRRARIIEISPEYCDVIIYRWEELTKQKHIILNREVKNV